MSVIRRMSLGIVMVCAVAGGVVITHSTPAMASIDPAWCTLHATGGNSYTLTCTDYSGGNSAWHLELSCQRGNGTTFNADGTNAYGTSYSQASCGTAEALDWCLVNLY